MSKLNLALVVLCLLVFTYTSHAQPEGRAYLDGKFFAPPGATVVLQKDGSEDLSLTASANGNAGDVFKFPKAYVSGTPYTLAIKSSSAGQTCRVEKGVRGTISSAAIRTAQNSGLSTTARRRSSEAILLKKAAMSHLCRPRPASVVHWGKSGRSYGVIAIPVK